MNPNDFVNIHGFCCFPTQVFLEHAPCTKDEMLLLFAITGVQSGKYTTTHSMYSSNLPSMYNRRTEVDIFTHYAHHT